MTSVKPIIVVGLDGSEVAAAALDWAMVEGEHRGYAVEIITVWHYFEPLADPAAATGPGGTELVRPHAGMAELARCVEEHVTQAAAKHPGVDHRQVNLGGRPPGETLVKAAAGAAMLVVGSHGTSGVLSALLGSVSAHCVRHAPCPVVVVRPGRSPRHWSPSRRTAAEPTIGPLP